MTQTIVPNKLYDRDFQQWCEDTVAKLKAQDFNRLDLQSLIEEIEGLAGRDKRELKSRLEVLLNHLLKRLYVPSSQDYRGWELTIAEQRRRLQDLLEQSPSLKRYFLEVLDDSWQFALSQAQKGYPEVKFPSEWLFSHDVEAILSEEFWSEQG